MSDVFDDAAMHGSGEELLVFVVHGHDDEELGTAWRVVVDLAESEAVVLEIVGIAGGGGVAHVSELALGTVWAEIKKSLGDWVVEDEVTVEESTIRMNIFTKN